MKGFLREVDFLRGTAVVVMTSAVTITAAAPSPPVSGGVEGPFPVSC